MGEHTRYQIFVHNTGVYEIFDVITKDSYIGKVDFRKVMKVLESEDLLEAKFPTKQKKLLSGFKDTN